MGENYRLGLDLGTNSIGWALVRLDEHGVPCGLLDFGAHIFHDGRDPTSQQSLTADRRLARSARRRRDRYLQRRRRLQALLSDYGLLPISKDERKALGRHDPYALRARALDGPLKPYELGRTLFHMNQRRGFKSNRLSGEEDEKERGKIAERIGKLREQIDSEAPGRRTLGEWLHRRRAQDKPVRFRPETAIFYPTRDMYEQEFDAIREAQEQNQTLTPNQWDALREIIIAQRPLKPVEVGRCTLDPSEPRAHKALPLAQEFRIYQEVNNLRICEPGQRKERPLREDEREILIQILLSGSDVGFSSLAKKIGVDEQTRINLASEKRKRLDGDATAKKLGNKNIFGRRRWNQLSGNSGAREETRRRQNEIVKALLDRNRNDDELIAAAQREWGLDEEKAARLCHARLPQGTVHLGETALNRVTPELAKGLRYDEAVQRHYRGHSDLSGDGQSSELPYYGEVLRRYMMPVRKGDGSPEEQSHGRIGNPTVHIGLNRLRKLVNEIIARHGKPDSVVIELARDLKNSLEDRKEISRRQAEAQEANEKRREVIAAAKVQPTPLMMRKVRLWEEQAVGATKQCPFCGGNISINQALSEKTEIEHLLPFSRTLDDSMANKVLAHTECNRRKGNRSPIEAFGAENSGKYEYSRILERARNLPGNKAWRFNEDAMERYEREERGFLNRQLDETRYLSRVAREYMTSICPKEKVYVVTGQLTAMLRGKWGITTGKLLGDGEIADERSKNRNDHRHHAIDALVIALTSRSLLQRVATLAGQNREAGIERLLANFPKPWDGFSHEEIRQRLARVVVSHRPEHGLAGQLHNKTAYGMIDRIEEGDGPFSNDKYQVVVTKPLASTKPEPKLLDAVRDAALKEALKNLWDSVDKTESGKPAEKWKKFTERAASPGELGKFGFSGAKHGVRRVRVTENLTVHPLPRKGLYKAVKPDSNAFMDVFEMPNGKWQAVTITRLAANAPDFQRRHNELRPHPAARRIARLFVGDMVATEGSNSTTICKIQQLSGQLVVLAPHNESNTDKRDRDGKDPFNYTRKRVNALRRIGFRKIRVDILGRIWDPGPRS